MTWLCSFQYSVWHGSYQIDSADTEHYNKQRVWCVALACNYFWLQLNRNIATQIISQDIFLNLFSIPIKYTGGEKKHGLRGNSLTHRRVDDVAETV